MAPQKMTRKRAAWYAKIFLGIWRRSNHYRHLPALYALWLRRHFLSDFGQLLLKYHLRPADLGFAVDLVTKREWRQLVSSLAHLQALSGQIKPRSA